MSDPDSIEWPDAAPAPLAKAPRRSREMARPVEPVHPADEEGEIYTPAPYVAAPPSRNGHTSPSSIPQSDPEESLLSCCLIEEDNGQVLRRCEEAGITPDSFSDPKHAIVYGRLQRMRAAGLAITTAILGQELPKADLERIGKWPFILQISKATSTTAEAGYFIESLRNRAILAEVIAQSKRRIEIASANGIDVPEFLAEYQREAASLSSKAAAGSITTPLVAATDFRIPPEGDASILLGNRYLNRGDGAVLSGTSGMGKSSMSVQMAAVWSLGRPAFGIPPNGPLRSLIIQSEDSAGDVAEMMASVAFGLQLSAFDLALVGSRVKIQTERVLRGDNFLRSLATAIRQFQPDIVWLNPLQAFVKGDITQSEDLGNFLREGLNGLNPEKFAYIIVHHTTKPATGKDRADRQWHEVMYDMAGGAEIINWARAILSLRASADEGEFNLVLAKRGRRAGVTKEVEQGAGFRTEPCTVIPLRHAKGFIPAASLGLKKDLPLIFWEARPADAPPERGESGPSSGGRPPKFTFDDYRNLMPPHSGPGMEIGPLTQLFHTNKPIKKEVLHNCLKRWARDGQVEIIATIGHPMRYRLPV